MPLLSCSSNRAMSEFPAVILVEGSNSQFSKMMSVFEKAALSVKLVKHATDFQELLQTGMPSLVLMDLHLNGKDAIDVMLDLQRLDLRGDYMLVVVGEQSENYVEVAALNAGADDYLSKPMNKRIFASKVNAWMRRQAHLDKAMGRNSANETFNLDRERYSLIVRNQQVHLQRKEFEIISLLASRPRKVFSRKEIKELIWGASSKARNRTIDVHITNLRSKIGPEFIKTYKGVGYSFET